MKTSPQRSEFAAPRLGISVKELRVILPIGTSKIYALCEERLMPHKKIGGQYLFDPDEIRRWFNGHSVRSEDDMKDLLPTLQKEKEAVAKHKRCRS